MEAHAMKSQVHSFCAYVNVSGGLELCSSQRPSCQTTRITYIWLHNKPSLRH